ncbi:hypothetical protein BGZ65_008194 [Modicella reniformis]|uniref:Uncharacterized protein n=1 Tax=Modicella reniformis TaxID=1440133 RepID=A0A9P6LWU0_9FUNG|nr:hypothetical protein BGZ65_008194 [Modicella reniformis]
MTEKQQDEPSKGTNKSALNGTAPTRTSSKSAISAPTGSSKPTSTNIMNSDDTYKTPQSYISHYHNIVKDFNDADDLSQEQLRVDLNHDLWTVHQVRVV